MPGSKRTKNTRLRISAPIVGKGHLPLLILPDMRVTAEVHPEGNGRPGRIELVDPPPRVVIACLPFASRAE